MLHRSFKPAKCKTALKLAVSRIKLLNNKRENQVKLMKRELAQLLGSGQVQTARIRVEHVIREEKTLTAYNLIEIYCELIAARLPIIESQKNCPIDLKEAISSVIYASPRCADVPELMDIRKHLKTKYGKDFIATAIELRPDCGVNRMLVEKLSANAPDGQTKLKILTAIAEEHNVKWDPDSFSGNDSMPPQDLLNGPNTFEAANKFYSEAPPAPAQPIPDYKGHPNVQAPSRHDEKQDVFVNLNEQNRRMSSSSENFASTGVATNKATTSAPLNSDLRSSGSGTEHLEYRQSYPGSENAFPSGKQSWNMEFKDATSAAQAAAESAERASVAARAAAELSRQYSSESPGPYGHVPKDEQPHLYANSKFQTDHVAKGAENIVFRESYSGERDEHTVDKEQEELAGAAERFVRDGSRNNDRYTRASSLKPPSASIDNVRLMNSSIHAVDKYSQRKSSESDSIHFLDEVSKKKQSSEFDLRTVAKKPDSVKSEETAYVDENAIGKELSGISRHSHSSSLSHDQVDILRKNDDVVCYGDRRTEKQSSRASSRPHSSGSGDVHEDIFKMNDYSEDPFVHDDRSMYRNTSKINSPGYTVVFDSSSSDDGNDKLDIGNYKEQETGLNFSSPRKESYIRRPSYMRKPSENSLLINQATEDTSIEDDQSSSSTTVGSSIGFRAGDQEPYSEKSSTKLDKKVGVRTFTKHVDSDDDNVEEERRQETSISKQPYNQKLGSELNKKFSSRAPRTYFDSDNSDSDKDLPKLTSSSNARPGTGFSRTKVSYSNSGRSYSKTTVSSLESRTPDYRAESKSSSSSSNVGETLPKPLSKTKSSDDSGSQERHRLVDQDSPKPIPESRRSPRVESSKPSTREQTSNSLSKVARSGVTGASNSPVVTRETASKDTASHVHPKLPDSDAFTAFFLSLRQTRE